MRKIPYILALTAALVCRKAAAQTLKSSVELAKAADPNENALLRVSGGYDGQFKIDTFMDVYGGQEKPVEYFGKVFIRKPVAKEGFWKNVSGQAEINYTTGKPTRFRFGVKYDTKAKFAGQKISGNVMVTPFCYNTEEKMRQTTLQTYVDYAWRGIYAEHWSQYNWNYSDPDYFVHELTVGKKLTSHIGIQGQIAHNVDSPGTTYRIGVRVKK